MNYLVKFVLLTLVTPVFAKAPTSFRGTPNGPAIAVISEKQERIAEIQDIHNLSEDEATVVTMIRLLPVDQRAIVGGYVADFKQAVPASVEAKVLEVAKAHELDKEEAYMVTVMRYSSVAPDSADMIHAKITEFLNEVTPLIEK